MAELLTNNIWEVCLGIVKHQGVQLMVLENFGELSFWIVDSFSTFISPSVLFTKWKILVGTNAGGETGDNEVWAR